MDIITTHQLTKFFGKVAAVRGVDLTVTEGEIFGFLGPNGAGKTTTLRMLATLLPIDSGEAYVAGYNVRSQPQEVRQRLGYVSQMGGADRLASGREDLLLQGKLYGMTPAAAEKQADALIAALDLGEFADRRVATYSGGQKRRLDVALGLMHSPQVLFLDEPTTGLDPQNRANLWVQIKKLRDTGTTIFLTTHYLEEADALSDRLAIMDYGQIVAQGTARELKQQTLGDSITLGFKNDGLALDQARALVRQQPYVREVAASGDALKLYVREGAATLPELLRLLDGVRLAVSSVTLAEPSLDDVFLARTGRSLRDASGAKEGVAA